MTFISISSPTDLVYDNSYVNKAQNLLNQAKNFDVAPYLTRFSMPEVTVPEQLEPLVETAKDAGVEGLKTLWARRELDGVRGNLESIYAQAAAAAQHYDAERSLEENIEAAIKLVVEIVEEELKALAAAGEQKHSPVTYYNAAQGEMQAQFDLPFDLKNLQSMPDMSPLEAKAEQAAQTVKLAAQKVEAAAKKVAKYLHLHEVCIDSAIFKLHYVVTVVIFVVYSLLVTISTYAGDPIDCHTREDARAGYSVMGDYLDW